MTILLEADGEPTNPSFDIIIAAAGYESRCRWVIEQTDLVAPQKFALTFGYLEVGDYQSNVDFFLDQGFTLVDGITSDLVKILDNCDPDNDDAPSRVLVDISSMSRSMIANIILAMNQVREQKKLEVWVSYAASKYSSDYNPGPIREAAPIKREMAGWSSRPEVPLGAIFGLGCEPGLVLGALQTLEPDKVWAFTPNGFDAEFNEAGEKANANIGDIFDVTYSAYDLNQPTITRGRFEALINAVEDRFRLIAVPFGPKLFSWLVMSTVVFQNRSEVGIWTFSSGDKARPINREAEGPIVWHHMTIG